MCCYLAGDKIQGRFVVDSVSWVGASSIVATSLWSDGDSESPDTWTLAITWSSWAGTEDAAPIGLEAVHTGFMPLAVSSQLAATA